MLKVKIGDMAPDFTLKSNMGEYVTLSQFRKTRNVILFFYPMNESPVCTREACAFKDSYEAFKELDAEVIGASSQDVKSNKSFADHHNLPFLLLSDMANKVRSLYGVPTTLGFIPGRATYVIDKEGLVRQVFSSQFQPARHAKEAICTLKRMKNLG